MRTLTECAVLDAWEGSVEQPPVSRAVKLAALASDRSEADIWDLPVGARDALLIALRRECFGEGMSCVVTCPRCGDELDVALRADDLRAEVADGSGGSVEVDGTSVRYRPVTSRDLLAVDATSPDARDVLVRLCLIGMDTHNPAVGERIVEAVAARLGDADPAADLHVALSCASCGHDWSSPFPVADHVWAEVDVCAQRLLNDIHALARAYGWTEADVLALSPMRRRYYLAAAAS